MKMKAVVITRSGGPEVLELQEREAPVTGAGEVRVRIHATAVNRADLLQRMGAHPAPPDAPPDIPGIELAGEVETVGAGVTEHQIGDRVFGLCGGGSYAELIVVPARTVVKIPAALSYEQAAAVPEAFITAWDALVTQAGLTAGETVLIHAAGSGVGTAAVQIARAVGARVWGTARTAAKLEDAQALGLEVAVVVGENGKFADQVRAGTGGAGVDVILDLVGGNYVTEDLSCAALRGRIVLVGLLAGSAATLDLARLLHQRLRLFGTVLRVRPLEEKIAAVQAFARHVIPLFERGALAPVVDRVWPLAEAAAAHTHLASNLGVGKVILTT